MLHLPGTTLPDKAGKLAMDTKQQPKSRVLEAYQDTQKQTLLEEVYFILLHTLRQVHSVLVILRMEVAKKVGVCNWVTAIS